MNPDIFQKRKQIVYNLICDDMYVPMKIKELAIVLGVKKEIIINKFKILYIFLLTLTDIHWCSFSNYICIRISCIFSFVMSFKFTDIFFSMCNNSCYREMLFIHLKSFPQIYGISNLCRIVSRSCIG